MATIVFLQREGLLEHQCYRSVDEMLPDLKLLDYAQVAKVQIKRLQPIVHYIMDDLKLPNVTEACIRATLKRAGIQLPRSRAS